MKPSDFEELVEKAVLALPLYIREKMENVVLVVEQRPSEEEGRETGTRQGMILLGLYQGIPQTTWGRDFSGRLPDKITIFQESVESLAHSPGEIAELVKSTVWHEIAHHFGLDEERLRFLEKERTGCHKTRSSLRSPRFFQRIFNMFK
ncbi:metallopeptidase family protein [candidate division NPL-UPA2 bacterium]|nr:metallopeptidase family protein [candidate division NPL-UPA2 bacterium]